MLVFIALSLGLCFLEEFADSSFFTHDFFIYAALISALAAIVATFLKTFSDTLSYDWFASSSLLLWFAYWKPLFEPQSPIFFFYSLYFAMMTALILLLSTNHHRIDQQTKEYMRYWDKERVMPAWFVMLCVLGSLAAVQHYQLFPVLMTLLTLRFAFSMSLK